MVWSLDASAHQLSAPDFALTTVFVITASLSDTGGGVVTHDDGFNLYNGVGAPGSLVGLTLVGLDSGLPVSPTDTNYTGLGGGPFTLIYVSANGTPEQLRVVWDGRGGANPIPLPAALPLLLSGLAGMGVVGWRKSRKSSAKGAALLAAA